MLKTIISLLALSLLPLPVWAANPASGEINDESPVIEWAGSGPYVFTNLTPQSGMPVCEPSVPVTCDEFTLNVNFSDAFRMLPENQKETVRIGIEFPVTTGQEDYDLYVYDSTGKLIGESAGAVGVQETIAVPLRTLKNGSYSVQVIPYTPLGTNYAGAAQLGKPAKSASAGTGEFAGAFGLGSLITLLGLGLAGLRRRRRG